MVPILTIPPRRARQVEQLSVDGPAARRLRELGVITGARIIMLGRAPLGDPILISVSGSRIAIRSRDASRIFVRSASEALL